MCREGRDLTRARSSKTALDVFGVAADRPRLAMQRPSNAAVRAVVEAGMGAAVIAASVAAPGLDVGLPARLPGLRRHDALSLSPAAAFGAGEG